MLLTKDSAMDDHRRRKVAKSTLRCKIIPGPSGILPAGLDCQSGRANDSNRLAMTGTG
jgi:hypothetical protein